MPQFDFYSFTTQICWVLFFSFMLYIFFLKYILRNVAETIKFREKFRSFIHKSASTKISKNYLYTKITKFTLKS
jgi:hypothetical protein